MLNCCVAFADFAIDSSNDISIGKIRFPNRLPRTTLMHLICLWRRVAGFIFGDLDKAIREASQGKKVKWRQLADWKLLTKIRDALDKLPASLAASSSGKQLTAQSNKVTLFGPRDCPSVNGKEKPKLGLAQFELITKLILAGEKGCKKSQLENVSTNYWQSLKALKKSDKDWDSVIHFPGKPHGGYWID